jgi:hypothetical protein
MVTSFTVFTAISFLYLGTCLLNDKHHKLYPQEALHDWTFRFIPHVRGSGCVTDFVAATVIFGVAGHLLRIRDFNAFSWGIVDLAMGKLLSATLHSWTVLPDSQPAGLGKSVLPLMGGMTDRLMSNHVFELGVALHIAQGLGFVNTLARLCTLALFSCAILASRGHYAVDVVLAWWVLGFVGRLFFTRQEESKQKIFNR